MKHLLCLLLLAGSVFGQIQNSLVRLVPTPAGGAAKLQWMTTDRSHLLGIRSPATAAADVEWTWPNADAAGSLCSDGSGTLSWGTCGSGLAPYLTLDPTGLYPQAPYSGAINLGSTTRPFDKVYANRFLQPTAGSDLYIGGTGASNIRFISSGSDIAYFDYVGNFTPASDGTQWLGGTTAGSPVRWNARIATENVNDLYFLGVGTYKFHEYVDGSNNLYVYDGGGAPMIRMGGGTVTITPPLYVSGNVQGSADMTWVGAAWTPYTPVVTPFSGGTAFVSLSSCAYKYLGKTVAFRCHVEATFSIAQAGYCVSLPAVPQGNYQSAAVTSIDAPSAYGLIFVTCGTSGSAGVLVYHNPTPSISIANTYIQGVYEIL